MSMRVKFTQIATDEVHGLFALDEEGFVWGRVYDIDKGATWLKLACPERSTLSSKRVFHFSPRTVEPI